MLTSEQQRQAACQGSELDFFDMAGRNPKRLKAVCARCPIKAACLASALAVPEEFGVWGGTTPGEREDMRDLSDRVSEGDEVTVKSPGGSSRGWVTKDESGVLKVCAKRLDRCRVTEIHEPAVGDRIAVAAYDEGSISLSELGRRTGRTPSSAKALLDRHGVRVFSRAQPNRVYRTKAEDDPMKEESE